MTEAEGIAVDNLIKAINDVNTSVQAVYHFAYIFIVIALLIFLSILMYSLIKKFI